MFATTLVATEFSLVQVRSPLETHADRKRKKKQQKSGRSTLCEKTGLVKDEDEERVQINEDD